MDKNKSTFVNFWTSISNSNNIQQLSAVLHANNEVVRAVMYNNTSFNMYRDVHGKQITCLYKITKGDVTWWLNMCK